MCGRINLRASPVELAEFFELFREPVWEHPRFNIGPMQNILVIRQKPDGVRVAEPLQWGLVPSWARNPSISSSLILARSDTVAEKSSFQDAIRKRRCLIPVSGYFEWQVINSKTKQPWHVFRADGQPMALAGLWEHWQSPDGHILESCSMITTEPNAFIAEFHDRMPVILDRSDWQRWLDPQVNEPRDWQDLLGPCPEGWLERTAVSTLVNNVRNDSPDCIKPVRAERTLF